MLRPGNRFNVFFSHKRSALSLSQKDATVNIFLTMPGIRFVKLGEYQKNFLVHQYNQEVHCNLNFLAQNFEPLLKTGNISLPFLCTYFCVQITPLSLSALPLLFLLPKAACHPVLDLCHKQQTGVRGLRVIAIFTGFTSITSYKKLQFAFYGNLLSFLTHCFSYTHICSKASFVPQFTLNLVQTLAKLSSFPSIFFCPQPCISNKFVSSIPGQFSLPDSFFILSVLLLPHLPPLPKQITGI